MQMGAGVPDGAKAQVRWGMRGCGERRSGLARTGELSYQQAVDGEPGKGWAKGLPRLSTGRAESTIRLYRGSENTRNE
ncbi:hypothetical protein GCM10010507_43240 [Streptomyces cinnamoneus]|uniref:Uncharacterized protein n=1 Tax=Streptomyces cinnamoneus TaxID=53446 RepID=A0A918TSZ3_STRCJ|nr:hypothetical protein GCM10010507_43240 [Streptomyces cinnamoneus]